MAHIYMTFDFGTDEEKAQLARHKLDGWKQAFRLDKRVLYKFERAEAAAEGAGGEGPDAARNDKEARKVEKPAKSAKSGKAGKAKGKTDAAKPEEPAAQAASPVKLILRLAFSGHEKMTEERWLKRIPAEEPFKAAAAETVKMGEAGFEELEAKYDSLE